MKHNLLVHIL